MSPDNAVAFATEGEGVSSCVLWGYDTPLSELASAIVQWSAAETINIRASLRFHCAGSALTAAYLLGARCIEMCRRHRSGGAVLTSWPRP